MRVLTWNCRRAKASSPLWEHLRELNPDIAILQEVSSLPSPLQASYDIRMTHPRTRKGGSQRFASVLLVKGIINEEIALRSTRSWVDAQLKHFAPNLLAHRVTPAGGASLIVIGVYSPAWPVDRAAYRGLDVSDVKLPENPEIWVSDLLVSALRDSVSPSQASVVAGDFNACETFDSWKNGPRGNRRWLDRMAGLGLIECLRHRAGRLTPTFRRPGTLAAHCQIDHLFVSKGLAACLEDCTTGDPAVVFGVPLSDHLPIIAAFSWDVNAHAA